MRKVWLLLVVAGCGDSSEMQISQDIACADLANAICGQFQSCGAPAIKLYYGDLTTCQTRLAASCKTSLKDPGTTLTTNRLDACAKKLTALSCTDAFNHTIPDECKPTPGALADGTPCGDDSQCQSAYCKKPAAGVCGVCAKKSDACVRDDDCPSGLVCGGTVCITRVTQGNSCSGGQPCAYGLVCDGGTCKTPPGTGMACTATAAGGNCDQTQGNFCNPISNVCQAFTFANAGEPCGLVNMGYSVCAANGRCTGMLNGNCMAAAADGAACNATNGPNCQLPAQCINSVCVLPDTSTCK
jgi:hypothetical protein